MSRVTRVATIQAKPAKVLDYIADVEHHPAFISALKSVDHISGPPRSVGTNWQWTFSMGGVELKGKAETTAYEQEKRYAFKTTGGIASTFTYTVESQDSGTRLTIDVVYDVPKNVLGKIADVAVIERLNSQEGDRAAENLKAILET